MTHEIISIASIKQRAKRAADAGQSASDCPYAPGSEQAQEWLAAFLEYQTKQTREAA